MNNNWRWPWDQSNQTFDALSRLLTPYARQRADQALGANAEAGAESVFPQDQKPQTMAAMAGSGMFGGPAGDRTMNLLLELLRRKRSATTPPSQ